MSRARLVAFVAGSAVLFVLAGLGSYFLEEATGQTWVRYLVLAAAIIPLVIIVLRSDWMTRRK